MRKGIIPYAISDRPLPDPDLQAFLDAGATVAEAFRLKIEWTDGIYGCREEMRKEIFQLLEKGYLCQQIDTNVVANVTTTPPAIDFSYEINTVEPPKPVTIANEGPA